MGETQIVRKEQGLPAALQGLRPGSLYTFDELYRLAQVCHASGLFADVTDAAQAMIKIVKGQELGLPPMTAMTAFDLIQKRLFIKPWAIAAKINTCGYGSYRVVEETAERCTIHFARKYPGVGWQNCTPVTYTYAEAQAHGLTARSPHWKASPAHMLYQRAMGRGGAMYFPELLAGLEPPQDDTPIAADHHRQNIVDLFGDDPRGSTPQPPATVDVATGEVVESPEEQDQGVQNQDDPGASEGPSPDDALQAVADLRRQLDAILTAQGTNLQAWRNQQAKRFKRSFADLEPVILERLLVELQDASPRVRTPQEIAGPPSPSAWRDTVQAHVSTLPAGDLHTACVDALADAAYPESEGLALAARVLADAEDPGEETTLPF